MPDEVPSTWIALDLPDGTIPAVPGGVTDHHITIVYVGRITDAQHEAVCHRAQSAAANIRGPLHGVVAGVDSFEPSTGSKGKVPAFAPVLLPAAGVLRSALADLSGSEHQDYRPHITLAYLDDGDPLPEPVTPTAVRFTHLTVHRGPDVRAFPFAP
jgi:2'-5' RNA ligase